MKDELIYQGSVMYGLFLGCDEKKVEVIPFESVSKPLIVLSCRSWVCFKKRI